MASAFELYLRTGRRTSPAVAGTETKFNPWHDSVDGRFTFAGRGWYFAGGDGRPRPSSDSRSGARQPGSGTSARQSASARARATHTEQHDPRNPRNYSIYIVKRGDTLIKIAGLRRGLAAADLTWLNELGSDRLQIGQQVKLPHQQFLDEGKRARDTFLALAHYIDATGGKLPPNVARPPSLATQVEAAGVREVQANGYRYAIDVLRRPRHVFGEIQLELASRSRSAQVNAGKPDRRDTDDGGHYVAARFNGPRESFNHFAQDSNFNRGAYRAIEDKWSRAIRSRKRVFVDIVPHYRGTSLRPYLLSITWTIDGQKFRRRLPNEKGGR